jgi:undecaprenyl pyrophosphate phosphatase UppP
MGFSQRFLGSLQLLERQQPETFFAIADHRVLVTAFLGLLVSNYIAIFFESTLIVGIMLLVTGGILKLLTVLPIGTKTAKEMSYKDALWVGLLQAFAVLPGISRSGTTILGSSMART